MSRIGWLALAAMIGAGCGSTESGSDSGGSGGSAGGESGGAGGNAGTAGSAGSGGSAGTPNPKRSVEVRNPWGNTADNYVLDGDFEFSVQTRTWFDAQGVALSAFASGGRCRSGILCAKVTASSSLNTEVVLGDSDLRATLYARVDAPCSAVAATVTAVNLAGNRQDVWEIRAASEKADETGWCRYQGGVDPMTSYDSALLTIEASVDALIDAVTLEPVIITSKAHPGPDRREPFKPWRRPLNEPPRVRPLRGLS